MIAKTIAAALLGVALCLGGVPGVLAPTVAQAGWHHGGVYYSYQAACHRASYLRACGYCTYIKPHGCHYCVYYH